MLDRAFSEAVTSCCLRVFLEKFQEFVLFRNYHWCVPDTIELLERTRHYSDECHAVTLVGLLFDFYYSLIRIKFRDYLFLHVVVTCCCHPHSEDESFHVVVDVVVVDQILHFCC